jgi:hypothetical protein
MTVAALLAERYVLHPERPYTTVVQEAFHLEEMWKIGKDICMKFVF